MYLHVEGQRNITTPNHIIQAILPTASKQAIHLLDHTLTLHQLISTVHTPTSYKTQRLCHALLILDCLGFHLLIPNRELDEGAQFLKGNIWHTSWQQGSCHFGALPQHRWIKVIEAAFKYIGPSWCQASEESKGSLGYCHCRAQGSRNGMFFSDCLNIYSHFCSLISRSPLPHFWSHPQNLLAVSTLKLHHHLLPTQVPVPSPIPFLGRARARNRK